MEMEAVGRVERARLPRAVGRPSRGRRWRAGDGRRGSCSRRASSRLASEERGGEAGRDSGGVAGLLPFSQRRTGRGSWSCMDLSMASTALGGLGDGGDAREGGELRVSTATLGSEDGLNRALGASMAPSVVLV